MVFGYVIFWAFILADIVIAINKILILLIAYCKFWFRVTSIYMVQNYKKMRAKQNKYRQNAPQYAFFYAFFLCFVLANLNFGFAEDTPARQNQRKNPIFPLVLCSLIRIFVPGNHYRLIT